jgi:hypothetical protein
MVLSRPNEAIFRRGDTPWLQIAVYMVDNGREIGRWR